MSTVTIELRIHTPGGETWLKRLSPIEGECRYEHTLVDPSGWETTPNGESGVAKYELERDGVYESYENSWGFRYWIVENGKVTETNPDDAFTRAFE